MLNYSAAVADSAQTYLFASYVGREEGMENAAGYYRRIRISAYLTRQGGLLVKLNYSAYQRGSNRPAPQVFAPLQSTIPMTGSQLIMMARHHGISVGNLRFDPDKIPLSAGTIAGQILAKPLSNWSKEEWRIVLPCLFPATN